MRPKRSMCMIVKTFAGATRALALMAALLACAASAHAQQPSNSAIALAREIITAKGVAGGYDSVVPGVIERAKAVLLQTNPTLGRDLNEVALRLRAEYAARVGEPLTDAAKLY